MMPRAAMPPATERPIIVPEWEGLSWGAPVADGEGGEVVEGVLVTITVTGDPCASVDILAEVIS